jgi:O-antigen/teichoic acid export membrane protein
MEFGRHLDKGFWALADKSLPALYGIGSLFLVVRILPEQEYGAFVIIQTILLLTLNVGQALAFQPLTKYAAQEEDRRPYVWSSLLLGGSYAVVASIILIAGADILVAILAGGKHTNLGSLFPLLPFLLVTGTARSFVLSLLQADYRIRAIFVVDACYFVGVLAFVGVAIAAGKFTSAQDALQLLLLAQTISSVVGLFIVAKELRGRFLPHRQALRDTWGYGKYSVATSVFYSFFTQADVFVISSFSGITFVASYNAAKVLTRTFDVFNQIITLFLIPFSARHYAQGNTPQLVTVAEKSICFSLVGLLPVMTVMVLFPDWLLAFLYGGKYVDAAFYVRVFGLLAFTVPWTAVASSYMAGMGKVKEALLFGVILMVTSGVLYVAATIAWGPHGTVMAVVASSFIFAVILILYLRTEVPLRLTRVALRIADILSFLRSRWTTSQKENRS